MALRELLAAFEIGVDDAQLKAAHGAVEKFKGALGTVATAVAGAFALHEVSSFLKEQIHLGAELDDQAQRLGVTTEALEKFEYAAKLSGVESEGAAHALMHLNKALGEALLGNAEAQQTFGQLGVKIKDAQGNARELTDIVPDLADAFSKLKSPQEQTAQAMKIFGKQGSSLIPLLKGGKEGVAALYEKFEQLGGGLAKGFVQAAAKADDELDNFSFAFRNLKSQLTVSILPGLTDLITIITRGAVWLRNLAKETNVVKVALYSILGVSAALAAIWLVLNFEIALVVLAFAALFLVVEDIYTLFTGGHSLIGRFIDKLFGVGASKKFVEGVKEAVQGVVDVFTVLGPIVSEVGGILSTIWQVAKPYLIDFFKFGIESMVAWFGIIKEFYKFMIGAWASIAQVVGQALQKIDDLAPPWLKLLLGNKLGAVKSFGAKLEETGAGVQQVLDRPTVSQREAEVFGTRSSRQVPNVANQQNQININVNGGPTNADTGNAVSKGVKRALGGYQSDLNAARAAQMGE